MDRGSQVPDPILEKIVKVKRAKIPSIDKGVVQRAKEAPPAHDFYKALSENARLSLIAEIKRASPSKGMMRPDLDPSSQARIYQDYGASAVSVLTEQDHFHGSLQDLVMASAACTIPVLRKDFIIDPIQVYESRAHGADAILLIVAILSKKDLKGLLGLTLGLGMHALVEAHDEEEVRVAVDCGARIIGINNRDLKDFTVDIRTTKRLAPLVPRDRLIISESGIHGAEEARKVASWGARGILVGEALVKAHDLPTLIKGLTGIRCVRGK